MPWRLAPFSSERRRVTSMSDQFSLRDIEFHRQTAASYDAEVTERYGVYHRLLLEPYLDRVAEELAPGPALDLGSGTGVVSLALAERGFDVVGVDHSPEMTEIARQKLSDANVRGSCRFVVGDARELPYDDDEFACVTCQGLLHHLREVETCLRELARVLRPGGRFYISEPCSDATPLKQGLRAVWHLRGAGSRKEAEERPASAEARVAADNLRVALDTHGLEFDMRFLTHLGPLQRAIPERPYMLAVRATSWPWRSRRGDLVFVFGRKPLAAHTPRSLQTSNLSVHAQPRYAFVRRLLVADFPPPARVIELGSAPGDQIASLAKLGYECTSVDIGDSADEWAGGEVGRMDRLLGDAGVVAVQWNLEQTPYPFPDAGFDAVLMTEVYEHLRDYPARSLEEVRRLLRPGGRLYFTTPNQAYLVNRLRLLMGRNVQTPLDDWIAGLPHARHAREYTFEEAEELLRRAGLTVRYRTSRHFHAAQGRAGVVASAGKQILSGLARVCPELGPEIVIVAERPGK